ncbi:MAG: hypothetical protein ACR2OG_04530 [Gemmatimonadaceae bacterium]
MPEKIDPGLEPGAPRRVIVISIVFILFGIVIIPMSLTAYRSGQPIPMLSKTRPIYGWEGLLISFLAVLAGIGGIWAALRKIKPGSV